MRCPGGGLVPFAEFGHDPGFEERFHQRQHAFVLHPRSHSVHQGRVVDAIEARLDIGVQHPAISLGTEQVNLGYRVVRTPVRPEPVRARTEVRLENGLQDQLQCGLHHPVGGRREGRFILHLLRESVGLMV